MAEQASEQLRNDVHKRAGGVCECTMKGCSHHTGRCTAVLRGPWEVHRITAGGLLHAQQRTGAVSDVPSEHA